MQSGEESGPSACPSLLSLPRNVWAVSIASFLMDVSSEMVINVLPLFLANVLGVRTVVIGLVDGVADATANVSQFASGWLSDRLRVRKSLAVTGYALATLSRPFLYVADTWLAVLAVRFVDRLGKGVRTAPRDALVADSIAAGQRGLAFGFHRTADTGGAVIGLAVALAVVAVTGVGAIELRRATFQRIVLVSLVPAALSVLALAALARDIPPRAEGPSVRRGFGELGTSFHRFLAIVGLFTLGNSSDAFILLRAQERGMEITHILGMLIAFNLVYALASTPAGRLSDRVGRRRLVIAGWLIYALVYLGSALVTAAWQVWPLMALYGVYYGATYGTLKAMVADIVPAALRGTAYGAFNGLVAVLTLPASVVAGLLWQGLGPWHGLGPAAPFIFGGLLALGATALLALWTPPTAVSMSTGP